MWISHIKIAWRSLKSQKLYTIINILGLSISLAIVTLLYMFILYEQSFDSMHTQKDAIYRVLFHPEVETGTETWANVPAIVSPTIKLEIPGIKNTTRLFKHDFGSRAYVKVNNVNFTEDYLYWCDNELFNIFNIKLIQGQLINPIQKPNTVILSESTSKKYFGDTDPIGQIIVVDNYKKLEVTAIFKDFPSNSTLDCNIVASFNSTYYAKDKSWNNNASFETFCLFDGNINILQANNQLTAILNKYVPKEEQWYSLSFQPMSEVHLYSSSYLNPNSSRIGDIKEVENLSLLAILILVIACINYVNLVIANSQKRNIEVGINKMLGATSKNMIFRFFTETTMVIVISLLIGLGLAIITIPLFNQIVGKSLNISVLFNFKFVSGLILIFTITTLLTGLYPAFYLSKFSPKAIFNPSINQSKIITLIRKGLVVFQFAASIALIIGSIVIFKQLQYIQDKKLGFNPEGVIAISMTAIHKKSQTEALKHEFQKLNGVTSIAKAQGAPGIDVSIRGLWKNENDIKGVDIHTNAADASILEVLKLQLLAGRMPKSNFQNDTIVEVLLNKKGIDYLGFTPKEAIGKKVYASLGNNAHIVGVVNNFNFASLRVPIGAYAFHNAKREAKQYLLVRYKTEKLTGLMDIFEKTFNAVIPNVVFDVIFLDKTVQKMYEQEHKTSKIIIFFCGLAIFLGCLGLFALAVHITEQRTKEIGIRKVLGASLTELNLLLCKDFIILGSIGFIIAAPIAWYGLNYWLEGFTYRTPISWWVFLLSGLAMLIITLLVVSFKTISTAKLNPVDSLQTE